MDTLKIVDTQEKFFIFEISIHIYSLLKRVIYKFIYHFLTGKFWRSSFPKQQNIKICVTYVNRTLINHFS